ncbi:MAG TPA: DUF4412 domain-containing protein [Candidatus Omnitrophota bacterium]|nr:DUF4412 domain-containing protein [Candidatus Omnitrophota bacterium]HPD85589.1 DUF4412 domain-containing protein [Candidatus Omnitrophota bacterium]HRZ04371.1 DUF4412 domain-containing protein [Candidatus Omnitrophota bacterium]
MDKKNKKFLSVVPAVLFFVMILAVGITCSAWAEDFSADMVSRSSAGTMSAKIFVSGEKSRMETPESIIIVRNDKKVSWIIMPSEKMYMEQPINMSQAPKASKNFDGEVERISLGAEVVNGQPAEKFKVTYIEGGRRMTVFQWLKDGKFPIKIEAEDGSWSTEYKNISAKAQSADLFEIPAGYTKMSIPSMGSFGR